MNSKSELMLRKKRLFGIVKRRLLFILVPLYIVVTASSIITPLMLGNIMNVRGYITALNITIIILILIANHILNLSLFIFANSSRIKFAKHAVETFYRDIFRMSYDDYLNKEPMSILGKVDRVIMNYGEFYYDTIPRVFVNVLTVFSVLIITFIINPIIGSLMLAMLPITYFGYKALNKKMGKLVLEEQKIIPKKMADRNVIVKNADFIKQSANKNKIISKIASLTFETWKVGVAVNNYGTTVASSLASFIMIISNMVTVLLAYMILQDASLTGDAVFVFLVMPHFTQAVSTLVRMNVSFASISAANSFIRETLECIEPEGSIPLSGINSIKLNLKEVSVAGKKLLENVNCEFKRGDIVGVMGESGKGKSTLLKLIAKFRTVDGITINENLNLRDVRSEDYHKIVSYFSQEIPIISDTIESNLSFGVDSFDLEKIKNLSFLNKFNDLNEIILEDGANLSGGDKQRLALARYFCENADVVILDEPTNSLDKETEEEVLSMLFKQRNDKIFFLVSHNPDNMKYCNIVLKIDEGSLSVLHSAGHF